MEAWQRFISKKFSEYLSLHIIEMLPIILKLQKIIFKEYEIIYLNSGTENLSKEKERELDDTKESINSAVKLLWSICYDYHDIIGGYIEEIRFYIF